MPSFLLDRWLATRQTAHRENYWLRFRPVLSMRQLDFIILIDVFYVIVAVLLIVHIEVTVIKITAATVAVNGGIFGRTGGRAAGFFFSRVAIGKTFTAFAVRVDY